MASSEDPQEKPLGFVCSRRQACELCHGMCEPGDRILRVDLLAKASDAAAAAAAESVEDAAATLPADEEKPRQRRSAWVHRECALAHGCETGLGKTVCKHWRRFGSCRYGAACQFLHPRECAGEAPVHRRMCQGKRRAVRKDGRVGVLRRFALEQFGEDALRRGSGVLDGAGGHGELAFELSNLNEIPCCVVDPRPVKLEGFARKLALGMYHRNLGAEGVAHVSRDLSAPVRKVGHLGLYVDAALLELVYAGCVDETVWTDLLARAKRLAWTSKGLHGHEDAEHDDNDETDETDDASLAPQPSTEVAGDADDDAYNSSLCTEIEDGSCIVETIMSCSAVLGMHPDQATEPLVDLALRLNVPFAVVPCCVYSKLFPKRALADGTAVRSHALLVQYLCEKDSRIRTAKLDFEGKNTVVYFDPGWI